MEVLQTIRAKTDYSTRGWDREEASRYVIKVGGKVVEASHFRHFLDGNYIKDVIELPTSYGCAVGCYHCAATDLGTHEALTHAEVHNIANFVAEDNSLPRDARILVTYSGIGEASLMRATVTQSARAISIDFSNCYFNLTTVGIRPTLFADLDSLAEEIDLKYVQVSLLHSDSSTVHSIMRLGKPAGYRIEDIASAMLATVNLTYRLNYVVIRDFNSTAQTFRATLTLFENIKDRCVVRVSRMNETSASIRNKLETPEVSVVRHLADVARQMGFDAYHFYSLANDSLNCGQLAGTYSPSWRHVRIARP